MLAWFGPVPWGPALTEPDPADVRVEHVTTPVGQPCLLCREPVKDGDSGLMFALRRPVTGTFRLVPVTRECMIRTVAGPDG